MDVRKDVRMDVRKDVRKDVSKDVRKDVRKNVRGTFIKRISLYVVLHVPHTCSYMLWT